MKQYGERLRRKAIMALSKNLTEGSRKGKKLGILAVAVLTSLAARFRF